jgi:hypothetical protein
MTPRHRGVAVEDQGGVRFPLANETLLPGAANLASGLPSREWNHVHQQPPNPHPLCFSTRRAKASHVAASSALIAYSLMHPPLISLAPQTSEGVYAFLPRMVQRPPT